MEIKVGVRQSNRELSIDSPLSKDELAAAITTALGDDTTLVLDDVKGRSILVPAHALAYVEIGSEQIGRVGFGA